MTGLETRLLIVDNRYKADRNLLLAVLGAGILVQALLFWFVWQPDAVHPAAMQIRGASAGDAPALCPGEALTYALDLAVTEAGVYALDVAVWRVSPPAVVLFSETRRVVFAGEQEYSLARQWTVPGAYIEPETGMPARWMPGQYERLHAISDVSHGAEASIAVIPFAIREGCE